MAPVIIDNDSRPIFITPNAVSNGNSLPLNVNIKNLSSRELPTYAVGLFESSGHGPRKRKRLTHLTTEEKIMRRKLKNRVAAQTARDRKKARLETLEDVVTKIHEQTKKLLDVNAQLLKRTEAFEKENKALRKRLGLEATEPCSLREREELEVVKKEFGDIEAFERGTNSETSSGESICVLTSCESNGVVNELRSCPEVSLLKASECVSPVPAAGSCQSSEADPLASKERRSIDATSNFTDNAADSTQDEPDITSLLQALEAVDPEQCFLSSSSKGGNSTGSSKILAEDTSSNVKVSAHPSSDHEYTKPVPCILYNQTSSCQSLNLFATAAETTPLQSPWKGSRKLPALIEEPRNCTQQLDLQVPSELMNAIVPYKENASANYTLRSDDIDAVLDGLFQNDTGDVDSSLETESVDDGISLCDSPVPRVLNTSPLPISDCFGGVLDCQLDLFPQLAVI